MRKIIKGLTITALAVFTVFSASNVEASAKVVSIDEAVAKEFEGMKKAYDTSSKVTVKFTLKPSISKKEFEKRCKKNKKDFEIYQTPKEEQKFECPYVLKEVKNEFKKKVDNYESFYWGTCYTGETAYHKTTWEKKHTIMFSRGFEMGLGLGGFGYDDGTSFKIDKKNRTVTCTTVFPGQSKSFKEAYEAYDNKILLAEKVRVFTDGFEGFDKAMAVADFIIGRTTYGFASGDGTLSQKLLDWEKTGKKVTMICGTFAEVYQSLACAAGLERIAICRSSELNHAWNCVTIDGVTRYIDLVLLDGFADSHGAKNYEEYWALVDELFGDNSGFVNEDDEDDDWVADEYYNWVNTYNWAKAEGEEFFNEWLSWKEDNFAKSKEFGIFYGYPWEISRAEYYMRTLDQELSLRDIELWAYDWGGYPIIE